MTIHMPEKSARVLDELASVREERPNETIALAVNLLAIVQDFRNAVYRLYVEHPSDEMKRELLFVDDYYPDPGELPVSPGSGAGSAGTGDTERVLELIDNRFRDLLERIQSNESQAAMLRAAAATPEDLASAARR
jgi:hypothetical protein